MGLPQKSGNIIVAEQSGALNFVSRKDMSVVSKIENVPGSHGLFWNPEGTRIFSANIASKGPQSLYEINIDSYLGKQSLSVLDTEYSKPHNITVDFKTKQLYITHSGMNDQVSVFDISKKAKLIGTVTTGTNPFGLATINR